MPTNVDKARGPGPAARPSPVRGDAVAEPSRDLLPLGGPARTKARASDEPETAPEPPDRRLAIDALMLLGRLAHRTRPIRWFAPAFEREVDLVRIHLGPLRDMATLAASFGREAFNSGRPVPAGLEVNAVRVAYAIRWLELRDGSPRPPWRTWLDAPAATLVDDSIPA